MLGGRCSERDDEDYGNGEKDHDDKREESE
jgi:hypothetical protein